jgi:hypothetical protein
MPVNYIIIRYRYELSALRKNTASQGEGALPCTTCFILFLCLKIVSTGIIFDQQIIPLFAGRMPCLRVHLVKGLEAVR